MTEHQKPKVFISYSRVDGAFAEDLLLALESCGFNPYLDKHDIVPGEDWEAQLDRLIQAADTIVFVISPQSVASERCAWEVERAAKLGKRLIPAVFHEVTEAETPANLRRLNYVFFTGQGVSFGRGLAALVTALKADLDWLRDHTAYGEEASRWDQKARAEALLLRGDEVRNAKAWLARRPKDAPEATMLQREFFAESEKAEQARVADEAARAAAMKNSELDRVRAEQESDKLRVTLLEKQRRLTFVLIGAAMLALAMGGGVLWQQFRFAETRRQDAEARQKVADELRRVTEKLAQATVALAAGPGGAVQTPAGAVSDAALDLIVAYEVGTAEAYSARGGRPTWPGLQSGVVIGMGYDLGYVTEEQLRKDWGDKLPAGDLERLAKTVKVTGDAAQPLAAELSDISISRETAIDVLRNRTIASYAAQVVKTFPNAKELPPDSFGALVSLVYNRGPSLTGERRTEMANIRDLMEKRQFEAIPEEFRKMKRVWPTMPALQRRRDAEALLFEKGLLQARQAG